MIQKLAGTIFIIICLFVIGVVGKIGYDLFGPDSGYSAVLLTTGDVYFAKISPSFGHYVTLRDVYYPQIAEESPQTDIRLAKLGSEIHGPKTRMKINRDHIIMVQPLRVDSEVIKTIEASKLEIQE